MTAVWEIVQNRIPELKTHVLAALEEPEGQG